MIRQDVMSDYARLHTERVLADFGRLIGLGALVLEDGGLVLNVEGDRVTLAYHEARDVVSLFTVIDRLRANPDAGFLVSLMEFNALLSDRGEGALSYDKTANALVYVMPIEMRAISVAQFQARFESFLGHVDFCRKNLPDVRDAIAKDRSPEAAPEGATVIRV